MMDDELLPEIRKLAGEGRRVTLIFDREGWSPRRFKKWKQVGFDVITYTGYPFSSSTYYI